MMSDADAAKRAELLRALLSEFGLRLHGLDPGVTAFDGSGARGEGWDGEPHNFGRETWAWLEPLLVELRERRRLDGCVDFPRLGFLHLDGWAGRTKQRVIVLGETPKRYRIIAPAGERVRLGGRLRSVGGTESALVPKRAVTFEPRP